MRFLLFVFFAFFLSACTRVVKEPVFIPQKCDIIAPQRPAQTLNTPQDIRNILIYTEQLERDLTFCISGEVK